MINDCIDNVTQLDALKYPELKSYVGFTMICDIDIDKNIVEATLVSNEDINWLYEHGIDDWSEFVKSFSTRIESSKIKRLYLFELTDSIKETYSIEL